MINQFIVTEIDFYLNLEFRQWKFLEIYLKFKFRYDFWISEFKFQSNQNFKCEVV